MDYLTSLIIWYSFLSPIDPHVAIAVARVESRMNMNMVGPVGEIGMFQIRPEYSKFSKTELMNPHINIIEGLHKLQEAKNRCKHQRDLTWLVCYNVGITGGSRIKNPSKFKYLVKVKKELSEVKSELEGKTNVETSNRVPLRDSTVDRSESIIQRVGRYPGKEGNNH